MDPDLKLNRSSERSLGCFSSELAQLFRSIARIERSMESSFGGFVF